MSYNTMQWFDAARTGDVETLRAMLSSGMDVDAADARGWTALHWAAWNGQAEVVSMLLEAGADIEARDAAARDAADCTALHWAASEGHSGIAEALIRAGVDVNACGHEGRTALHWAARYGHMDVVSMLLKAGADVGARDAQGRTPRDVIGLLRLRATYQPPPQCSACNRRPAVQGVVKRRDRPAGDHSGRSWWAMYCLSTVRGAPPTERMQ